MDSAIQSLFLTQIYEMIKMDNPIHKQILDIFAILYRSKIMNLIVMLC